MSATMTNAQEAIARALLLGNQLWSGRPTSLYLSLHTSSPTDGTTAEVLLANSGEVVGKGYSRIAVPSNVANWTVALDTVTNVLAISGQAVATQDWGLITHIGIYNAAKAGTLLIFGALDTPAAIVLNGSASFPAGSISFQLGNGYGLASANRFLRYMFNQSAWVPVATVYFGLGTGADQNKLQGEPLAIEAASSTGYIRANVANTGANWPASTLSTSQTANAAAIANWVAATQPWGTMTTEALLDKPIVITSTYTQSTTTVTVTSTAHGLSALVGTVPYNSALGTLACTYANSSGSVATITLPLGHGFSVGDWMACDWDATSGHPTDGLFQVTGVDATASTVTVASGTATVIASGTVTVGWPLFIDAFFQTASTSAFPVSQRYMVLTMADANTFTFAVVLSQTVTTSSLFYSAANVMFFFPLATAIVANTGDLPSIPVAGTAIIFD